MNNYGFLRVAVAVPAIRLGDTASNTDEICRLINESAEAGVSLLALPELSITGYSCGDLFFHKSLLSGAEEGIVRIADFSRGRDLTIIAGVPVPYRGRLYDCAVVIRNGNIKGIVHILNQKNADGLHPEEIFFQVMSETTETSLTTAKISFERDLLAR